MPTIRLATTSDIPVLEALIARSARQLSVDDYTPAQVEAALGDAFGVDSQLIRDGTYFVAVRDGVLAACGGWSFRGTLFGADEGREREPARLAPATDAANSMSRISGTLAANTPSVPTQISHSLHVSGLWAISASCSRSSPSTACARFRTNSMSSWTAACASCSRCARSPRARSMESILVGTGHHRTLWRDLRGRRYRRATSCQRVKERPNARDHHQPRADLLQRGACTVAFLRHDRCCRASTCCRFSSVKTLAIPPDGMSST